MDAVELLSRLERPRRIDVDRRERIIRGAIDVIAEHGVEGTTHRRIAAAADVPLAATTYYFESLADLLVAAMTVAVVQDLERLKAALEDRPPTADVITVVARVIVAMTAEDRHSAIVITELYTAALRRPELREVAIAWEKGWFALLEPRVGLNATESISALASGIVQSALIRGDEVRIDELEPLIRRIVAASDAPPAPAA